MISAGLDRSSRFDMQYTELPNGLRVTVRWLRFASVLKVGQSSLGPTPKITPELREQSKYPPLKAEPDASTNARTAANLDVEGLAERCRVKVGRKDRN